MEAIWGLHHVTAVTRDAQTNVDFYRNVLGQRLIKQTVNFDVSDTYHFYFADAIGTPGSVLTFFAWPNTERGVRGNGETAALAYTIPGGSISFWGDYLHSRGLTPEPVEQRFGEEILAFEDPDGMRVELVASSKAPELRHWESGPIPEVHALRGFHSVTLWLAELEPTAELLTKELGYTFEGREGNRHRFVGRPGLPGSTLDILHRPAAPDDIPEAAVFGFGSIHHIAFRVPDDEAELEYQSALRQAGYDVTPVRDRSYFHSIYFREPGGVLFEIATDTPGFAVDEPENVLGESLKLPPWLEPNRGTIEQSLPSFRLKEIEKVT